MLEVPIIITLTEMYYTGSETASRWSAMRLHVEIKSWQPEV